MATKKTKRKTLRRAVKPKPRKLRGLAAQILRLTEDAKPGWPISFTTDDMDLVDICNVDGLRALLAAPRKETSDRVSKIAATILGIPPNTPLTLYIGGTTKITIADLKALAASCLSQDQTKGKRKP